MNYERQNQSMVIEARLVMTRIGILTWKGNEKLLRCDRGLYVDQGGGYLDIYVCKNSLNYKFNICILYYM